MDIKAINKAKSRLRVAKDALSALSKSCTYEDFTDKWYVFITAFKSIYTSLEQGAKISAQSRQWFGGKQNLRRSDDLLQYIYQARNDDEHGLEQATEFVEGALKIGVTKPGYSNSMRIDGTLGPGGNLRVQSRDSKPVLIEHTIPHVKLINVTDRAKKIYPPPKRHLGQIITDCSPLNVATLGFNYVESLVSEASKLA